MPSNSKLDEQPRQEPAGSPGQDDDPASSGLTSAEGDRRSAAGNPVPRPGPSLQDGRQVGLRLGLSFGLLIALLLGTAYLAVNHMQGIYAELEGTLNDAMLGVRLAQEGLRYSSENSRITMQVFLVKQQDVIDQLLARRAENTKKISAILPILQSRCDSEQEKQLLAMVKETRDPYVASYQRALYLLLTDKNREAATELMVQQTTPALFRYHAAWDEFVRFQFDQVQQVSQQSRQEHAKARHIMWSVALMMLALTGAIALLSARRVARVVTSRIRVQEEVHKLNLELERRVAERTQALQRTQDRLRGSLEELQEYTTRVEMVNQLVELLQSCLTLEEAYQQASRVLQHFFPKGTLLMLNPSRNLLDAAARWGEGAAPPGPFSPESCWALRKGRVHVAQPGNFSLLCGHVDPASVACHICVPMAAQGESLGVLSVTDAGLLDGAGNPNRLQRTQELASLLAEQISLALANLMLRETLKYQAVRDPLTGLFNRRHMEEALKRELLRAARNGNPVAVLMADLDHFKQFNDAFGHEAGDLLLRDLGALFAAEIRGGDIACRYGGEEFLLILSDTDLPSACERAERLQQHVRDLQVSYRGETLRRITLSIGVAGFPLHGTSASQIVTAADRALYKAKAAGRDRVVVAGEAPRVQRAPDAEPAPEVLVEDFS